MTRRRSNTGKRVELATQLANAGYMQSARALIRREPESRVIVIESARSSAKGADR